MKTQFKTLIRKSDGQWMEFLGTLSGIVECSIPKGSRSIDELSRIDVKNPIEWSLYDLIEVQVLPVTEGKSKEDLWCGRCGKLAKEGKRIGDYCDEFIDEESGMFCRGQIEYRQQPDLSPILKYNEVKTSADTEMLLSTGEMLKSVCKVDESCGQETCKWELSQTTEDDCSGLPECLQSKITKWYRNFCSDYKYCPFCGKLIERM